MAGNSTPRKTQLAKKLSLGAGSTILFFALAELVLRLAGFEGDAATYYLQFHVPEIRSAGYERDPARFWKLKPGFHGQVSDNYPWQVSVNAHGMRGPDVPIEKPTNTFRILSIGDSSAFGWGVPPEQTYAGALERILNENAGSVRCQVLNAGVPGYSSYQGLQYLRRELLAYKPDLVLVYFGLNDLTGARYYADKDQRFLAGPKTRSPFALLYRLRIYRLLAQCVSRFSRKKRFDAYFADTDHFRVAPKDYIANLNAMKKLGTEHGFKVYFITPVWHDTEKGVLYNRPYWLPAGKNIWTGITPTIDTYGHLKKMENQAAKLYQDVAHPTAWGHEIIAKTIYRTLKREGVLPE